MSLHLQTHLLHCRLTKTNWEITKFFKILHTTTNSTSEFFPPHFYPILVSYTQLLPPCRVLLIPLLFRLCMLVCMLFYYDRSAMASSELHERSIFVGVNIFEHCHLIIVEPLGWNYISKLHKHTKETLKR